MASLKPEASNETVLAEHHLVRSIAVMRPIAEDDMYRMAVETFICQSYKKIFNAKLTGYLPNLVAATTVDDQIHTAFGYSNAANRKLFLENYFEKPIEQLLSNKIGNPVPRNKIVEVGNLCITDLADSVEMLLNIARYLFGLGFEWIVCTATRYLRLVFLRSGSKPVSIAPAPSSRVKEDGTDWGSYYLTTPEILAGNVQQSIELIEQKLDVKNHLHQSQSYRTTISRG